LALRRVRIRLRPPPRSLAIWHFMETCHFSPPLAGFFVLVFRFLCSWQPTSAFFGSSSPPPKIPFLVGYRCTLPKEREEGHRSGC
jgi:hypothetical protein